MQLLKIIILCSFFSVLSACAQLSIGHHDQDYMKQAQFVKPLVIPPGVNVIKEENYYGVPNVPVQPQAAGVSLVPPGSNISQYQQQSHVKNTAFHTSTSLTRLSNGTETLIVSLPANQTWVQIGRALRLSGYQILDQDNSIYSYYILDTLSTNKKITQKTPIYRIYIKTVGNNSQVNLMNQQNQPVNLQVAQRILTTIQQQLV